jgi:hypothetical protein
MSRSTIKYVGITDLLASAFAKVLAAASSINAATISVAFPGLIVFFGLFLLVFGGMASFVHHTADRVRLRWTERGTRGANVHGP